MKNRWKLMVLMLAASLVLGGCGSSVPGGKDGKAESTASVEEKAEAEEKEQADAADEAVEDEELIDEESTAEEAFTEEELDYFAEDDYVTTSEKLTEENMENPFGGEAVPVSVWDGVETVADSDGSSYSTLSSYANNIALDYSIEQESGDAEAVLRKLVKKSSTEYMAYVDVTADFARQNDDSAWVMMSFRGKGTMPLVKMISARKIDENTALCSSAMYSLGTDYYGTDYTPEDKYLTMVKDSLGISESDGEEIALSEEDITPEITLHKYEFDDSRVGTKYFYVWEEDPYVMTAEDDMGYDTYEDLFGTESWSESMAELWYEEDESGVSYAEDEYLWDETDSDAEYDYYYDDTESGGDFYGDEEFYDDGEYADDEYFDDEYYDDESYEDYYDASEDTYVGYASTSAQGVYVSAEMYVNDDPDIRDTLMEEFMENLPYMGAVSLKRSEVKSSDNASWIAIRYGQEEEDDAYQDLVVIHAVVTDDDTYTMIEIYAPTDASTERLWEYLDAYGLDIPDTTIEVEQEEYDYGFDEEYVDDEELLDEELIDEEIAADESFVPVAENGEVTAENAG